ncbi:hypothetical protein SDJN03_18033, partial [Cucurbita argyrosperma subsp. sororia]
MGRLGKEIDVGGVSDRLEAVHECQFIGTRKGKLLAVETEFLSAVSSCREAASGGGISLVGGGGEFMVRERKEWRRFVELSHGAPGLKSMPPLLAHAQPAAASWKWPIALKSIRLVRVPQYLR